MERCTELEADLAELRAAYDQYFQGVDRLPPLKRHEAFKKSVARLKGSFVRQTAAKFRIESISQKFLTYERLWDRTIKEIENGTYKRDLARLKRRGGPEKQKSADAAFDIEEDLDISDMGEGADDLSSAIAAAEAAVTAKPVPPIAPAVPAIKPLVPGSAPVAGVAPAIKAVTPAIAPVKTGVVAPLAPAIPAVKTGVVPATAALTPPAGKPVITPAGTPSAAAKPAGATGSNPATRPVSGSSPALKPGANPALKPAATQMTQASRPPNAGGNEGLSDTKIKAIYDAYVMAKKRCGEDTRQVTYDSVASTLKKQVPELMRAHNAKSVEFKVVIKDGKAVLRVLPKEE